MDAICILLQLILSFYIFYSQQSIKNISFWFIGSIVGHLIIYLMNHLSHFKGIKTFFYIVDMILIILMASLISSSFWILAVAVNAEITARHKKKVIIISNFMLLGYLSISMPSLLIEQSILYVLVILSINTIGWYEMKMEKIKHLNEELRDKLYKANQKVEHIKQEVTQIKETTKVQERNLLAQRLHDKIGHTLAANIMQLEAIKIIVHENKEEAVKMLEGTIDNLRSGMDDIRNTLRAIKPERSSLGINQVKGILDDLKRTHNINTELSFEGDLSALTLNIWHVTLQNLKETITNLLKYSKADRLSVRIEVFHKIIKVQFKDNGFPIEHYEKGLGLMGIEERAQSINGRLVINTNNGFETLMIVNREGV